MKKKGVGPRPQLLTRRVVRETKKQLIHMEIKKNVRTIVRRDLFASGRVGLASRQ